MTTGKSSLLRVLNLKLELLYLKLCGVQGSGSKAWHKCSNKAETLRALYEV